MRKLTFTLIASVFMAVTAAAQQENKFLKAVSDVKFSGYGMLQYQGSDEKMNQSNSFNLRMARLSLDGKCFDNVIWKAQIQFNGNTSSLGSSPRLVDLFAEWQPKEYFKVKAGQFKRPFTFENPMNPIDQGFMSYAQNVTKLSGFSDRTGEHSSNGRDIGVQLQGDFLKNSKGRNLLHYQVAVMNGQGINVKDVDNRKDIIGGLWVMPVEGLRVGAFGWTGSYARTVTIEGRKNIMSLDKKRLALSAEYAKNDWTFRSEYIYSKGEGFKTAYNSSANTTDIELSKDGDKADGLYALVIAPVIKKKLHVKARYDTYNAAGDWNKGKTFYEIGADYVFTRNLQISVEGAYVDDAASRKDYNMIDVELCFRF